MATTIEDLMNERKQASSQGGGFSLQDLVNQKQQAPAPTGGGGMSLSDLVTQRSRELSDHVRQSKNLFNSLPVGKVIDILGTYSGSFECVGGTREIIKDLPTGLKDFPSKAALIQPGQGPEAQTVAIMKSGQWGHVAAVLGVDGDDVLVYDVNSDGKNTMMIRSIPASQIEGYWKGSPENVNTVGFDRLQTRTAIKGVSSKQDELDQAEVDIAQFGTNRVLDQLKGKLPKHADDITEFQKGLKFVSNNKGAFEAVRDALKAFSDPTVGFMKGAAVLIDNNIIEPAHNAFKQVLAWGADQVGLTELAESVRESPSIDLTRGVEDAFGLDEGILTTTDSAFQDAGFFMEQMTEFIAGSKFAVSKALNYAKSPAIAALPARIQGFIQLGLVSIFEGGASAAVTAVNEGEVFTEDGRINSAVKYNAILGGMFSGILGAPAAISRFVSPKLIDASAKELIKRSIRPSKNLVDKFDKAIDEVVDEVFKRNPNIKTLQEFDDAIQQMAKETWQGVQSGLAKAGVKEAMVDGNKIADALVDAVSSQKKLVLENPGIVKEAEKFAKRYRQDISVGDAQEILTDTNAGLSSFFRNLNRIGVGEGASLQQMNEVMQAALAKGLNTGIDDALIRMNVPSIRPFKDLYSKLATVGPAVHSRANLLSTRGPIDLASKISQPFFAGKIFRGLTGNVGEFSEGVASASAAVISAARNSADGLISRAFSNMAKKAFPGTAALRGSTTLKGLDIPFLQTAKSGAQALTNTVFGKAGDQRTLEDIERQRKAFSAAASPLIPQSLKSFGSLASGAIGSGLGALSQAAQAAPPTSAPPPEMFGPFMPGNIAEERGITSPTAFQQKAKFLESKRTPEHLSPLDKVKSSLSSFFGR